jgi:hypothetical protein
VSSAIDSERRQRPGLAAAWELIGKYMISIMGVAATIAEFAAVVAAPSARSFVRDHPFLIYGGLVVAVLIIMGMLNYAYFLRGRCAALAGRPASAHDLRLFSETMRDLAVDGSVLAWLRRADPASLSADDIPADVLDALERTAERPRMRPVGFDDPGTAAAFLALAGAIRSFCGAVERWTLARHNARWPGATAAAAADAATGSLAARHAGLLRAYDAFVIAAHARGIDAAD